MGYDTVDIAAEGEEALEKVEDLRPDLVLMDIHIKGEKDGIEVAGEVRSRFGIPVVYLTAFADEAIVQRAKITEPFGYILKPYQERDLETTVEIALYKHEADARLAAAHAELQQAHGRLHRQLAELHGRDRMVQCQMKGPTLDESRQEIVQVIADVIGVSKAVLYQSDGDGNLNPVSTFGFDPLSGNGPPVLQPANETQVAIQAFASGQPRMSTNKAELASPLVYGDNTVGAVWVTDFADEPQEEAAHTLWRLAQQSALLLRTASVNDALEAGDLPICDLLAVETELDTH
jgi:CheY-like chemotaxis protein